MRGGSARPVIARVSRCGVAPDARSLRASRDAGWLRTPGHGRGGREAGTCRGWAVRDAGGSARPRIARAPHAVRRLIRARLSRRGYAGSVIGRRFVPLVLVLALTSAASAVEPAAPRLGYDHPLTGRVWDVTHSRFVTLDTLATAVSAARFALLGERHDHPEHHQFQAWLLRRMVEAGRRPAVALEMLDTTQAPALARHLAAAPRDAAGLGDAVGWRASGWPAWRLYQPIAETALAAGLPIVAGNLPATSARAAARAH